MMNDKIFKTTLVICHHAGGTSLPYRRWQPLLDRQLNIVVIDLPGRLTAISEPVLEDINQIVKYVHNLCLPYLDTNLILYGHSMGGLIQYEYAKFLFQNYNKSAELLFITGCMAPSALEKAAHPFYKEQTDSEMLDAMASLLGDKPTFFQSNEMQYFLNLLRNDYQVIEKYKYEHIQMSCPIFIYIGDLDFFSNKKNTRAWSVETNNSCTIEALPGKHFFIFDSQNTQKIIDKINFYV